MKEETIYAKPITTIGPLLGSSAVKKVALAPSFRETPRFLYSGVTRRRTNSPSLN